MSIYPKFEIDVGISWGYGDLFSIAFSAPLEISLKPELKLHFEMEKELGALATGHLHITGGLKLVLAKKKAISLNIVAMGTTWWSYEFYHDAFHKPISLTNDVAVVNKRCMVCMALKKGSRRKRYANACPVSNVYQKGNNINGPLQSKVAVLEDLVRSNTGKGIY
ncbi:uncharacterized protein LOC106173232 [Lingula anatina]|uniref:Uncharacterized protein LOC106173232 n=1 Tax=Lingula anatina TaxID=7574 RepID=A0A1S3JH53_LINAN|nr:uncharacterized protein LOC106173232 [Lingula anatina]|eukprot:XP_013409740.1 uncharacterized protein LOC106173232 [Lingula anatina]